MSLACLAPPQPAPIYILDEVDAALDLSHTQNIGRMIRTHFPYSQFIVVSLKEGMFNNANVIYRTKVRGVAATWLASLWQATDPCCVAVRGRSLHRHAHGAGAQGQASRCKRRRGGQEAQGRGR